MKGCFVLVLALILGLTNMGFGQVQQGDYEVSVSGSYNNTRLNDGQHTEAATASVLWGHFFTDSIELGPMGVWTHTEFVDIYSVDAYGRFHFMTDQQIVPYVGGLFGVNYANSEDGDDSCGTEYGPLAGLKFFATEDVSIFAEYTIKWFDGDVGDDIDYLQTISIGVSFLY